MSRSYEYRYALEAARRREIENARNRQLVAESLSRFISLLGKMHSTGRSAYIPSEINNIESSIKRAEQLSSSDPAAARRMCYQIESSISGADSLAEAAIAEFELKEIKRVQAANAERQKLLDVYYQIVEAIKDPVVISMAQTDLAKIGADIKDSKVLLNKSDIENRIRVAVQNAEKKAAEWKKKSSETHLKSTTDKQLQLAEQVIKDKKLEDSHKSQSFIDRIQVLRNQLDTGEINVETVQQQISSIESEVDESEITEDIRRETVRAIVKQLKQQEFTVSPPELIGNDESGFVRITASRPSGKKAVCQIDLTGKIAYRFDHYEGMTCLKDIEKFNADLQSVYSVKLSDERILWSNPDKLSRDSNQAPQDKRRNG